MCYKQNKIGKLAAFFFNACIYTKYKINLNWPKKTILKIQAQGIQPKIEAFSKLIGFQVMESP